MRPNHASIRSYRSNRARHLYRRCRDCTLANADGNRFSSEPLLVEVFELPLFRRHHAINFLRQINPALLPKSESGGPLRNLSDPEFLRQGVKEDVARL